MAEQIILTFLAFLMLSCTSFCISLATDAAHNSMWKFVHLFSFGAGFCALMSFKLLTVI